MSESRFTILLEYIYDRYSTAIQNAQSSRLSTLVGTATRFITHSAASFPHKVTPPNKGYLSRLPFLSSRRLALQRSRRFFRKIMGLPVTDRLSRRTSFDDATCHDDETNRAECGLNQSSIELQELELQEVQPVADPPRVRLFSMSSYHS